MARARSVTARCTSDHRDCSAISRKTLLDRQRATKSPSSVVGLCTVVIRENMLVTAIAEDRAAALSDVRRCLHPTRRLGIELAQRLQLSILRFREDLNPHGGSHVHRTVFRLVFLSCLQGFPVVTHTA